MDQIEVSLNQEEQVMKSLEDSDDKVDSKIVKKAPRSRLIRKNNKSKAKKKEKIESTAVEESRSLNVTTPFGIFQSEMQKCQRIEHYLKKDIENFYPVQISAREIEQLDEYVSENYVSLQNVVQGDIEQIWAAFQPSVSQIQSYLEMVDLSQKAGNYRIIFNQGDQKLYCAFYFDGQHSYYKVIEISLFEADLLQERQQFFNIFKQIQSKYNNNRPQTNKSMSQMKSQVIFLYKQLCESSKKLEKRIELIKNNIKKQQAQGMSVILNKDAEDRYITFLIKKLAKFSLIDSQIDYWNFFKDNETIEQGFTPEAVRITDQKDFEDFMKKKKNKKGKKARYALHSGCLGCLNCYYETYNPFIHCQQCYVRFHKYCYRQYSIVDEVNLKKEVFCQSCYNKKLNINTKNKPNECQICGIKGLLSLPISSNNSKHMHTFCAMLNGLWTVNNQVIQFDFKKVEENSPNQLIQKCDLCQCSTMYVHSCSQCLKKSHVSCAFLAGWQMGVEFINPSNNLILSLRCCGANINIAENQKRRKFITNYKKQAYTLI